MTIHSALMPDFWKPSSTFRRGNLLDLGFPTVAFSRRAAFRFAVDVSERSSFAHGFPRLSGHFEIITDLFGLGEEICR